MSEHEQRILQLIQQNPFITQDEIATQIGLSRSSVAGYISSLTKKGKIMGRAYVLPSQKKNIICIGGANVDRKVRPLKPLQYGTSNPVVSTQACGGVARNVAENISKLGSGASLLTFVGDDHAGKWLMEETSKQQVDISQSISIPGQSTGAYTAILKSSGEMELALADMNIYERVTVDHMSKRWSFIASSELIFLDLNLPKQVIEYIITRCRAEGLRLCINTVSAPKAEKLPFDLHGVELLIPNRDEAEAITGIKIQNQEDLRQAARQLVNKGVQNVIITLGAEGAFYINHQGQMNEIAPFSAQAVDVTGAGDSFIAGTLVGLLENHSLETACQYGMACAALTIQVTETVHPDLSKQKMLEMIKQYQ